MDCFPQVNTYILIKTSHHLLKKSQENDHKVDKRDFPSSFFLCDFPPFLCLCLSPSIGK